MSDYDETVARANLEARDRQTRAFIDRAEKLQARVAELEKALALLWDAAETYWGVTTVDDHPDGVAIDDALNDALGTTGPLMDTEITCVYCGKPTGTPYDEHDACVEQSLQQSLEL